MVLQNQFQHARKLVNMKLSPPVMGPFLRARSNSLFMANYTSYDNRFDFSSTLEQLKFLSCRSRGGLSANEKEETFASNDKVG